MGNDEALGADIQCHGGKKVEKGSILINSKLLCIEVGLRFVLRLVCMQLPYCMRSPEPTAIHFAWHCMASPPSSCNPKYTVAFENRADKYNKKYPTLSLPDALRPTKRIYYY